MNCLLLSVELAMRHVYQLLTNDYIERYECIISSYLFTGGGEGRLLSAVHHV